MKCHIYAHQKLWCHHWKLFKALDNKMACKKMGHAWIQNVPCGAPTKFSWLCLWAPLSASKYKSYLCLAVMACVVTGTRQEESLCLPNNQDGEVSTTTSNKSMYLITSGEHQAGWRFAELPCNKTGVLCQQSGSQQCALFIVLSRSLLQTAWWLM